MVICTVRYLLDRKWGEPQNWSERVGLRRREFSPLVGVKRQFLRCPCHSVPAVSTAISRLQNRPNVAVHGIYDVVRTTTLM